MSVVIIKYNAGNIQSVEYALRRIGANPVITDDETAIRQADHVIFPGVGEASSTMIYLQNTGLDRIIPSLTQPVLGICLGMQLLCHRSEEGGTAALNIIDTDVRLFRPTRHEDKVPQVGWNSIHDLRGELFTGVPEGAYVYFVHSYYAELCHSTIATTDYTLPFSAALQHNNFYATQFHPEKSGKIGEQVLRNFISIR